MCVSVSIILFLSLSLSPFLSLSFSLTRPLAISLSLSDMVDGATRMDLFDCSVCGCNRPGGNSSLNSSSSAETYEKWAKATASKRTHRDGTVISKLATPRVPEAKQQDDQLEISVEEDVKAGKANVMQRSLSEGTNEPIGAGDGPSTQPGRTESAPIQPDSQKKGWRSNNQSFVSSFWKKNPKSEQLKGWKSEAELKEGTSGPLEVNSLDRKNWKNKASSSFSLSLASFGKKDKNPAAAAQPASPSTTGGKKRTYLGEEAVMLFTYNANPETPFPPDPRKELTALQGQKIDILDMRPDGWCLVRKPTGRQEYWLPGNFLSEDGVKPYYDG